VRVIRAVRSAASLLAVLLWLGGVGSLYLFGYVVPLAWLRPAWRLRLVSRYMKFMGRGILAIFAAGGARFRRTGVVETEAPVLVVMNHQSLLDILTVALMAEPYVPAFVTRLRYVQIAPLVSRCVRLLGSPIVDPKRDPRGALDAVVRGARELRHGLLIFPEGHRSADGAIRPFRTAGLAAALGERRLPVCLVVTDGFWRCRRLLDFVLNVHRIQGETEVLGTFAPPADPRELGAFLADLRKRMLTHLEQMRGRARAAA
jgi:1-acyl-sn-glycerol-3-phosphate acyltransferase